jgi:hypothetical protein
MTTASAPVPDPLTSARLKLVLGVSVVAMALSGVAAWTAAGWWSCAVITLSALAVIAGWAFWKHDSVLYRLLAAGLVAAFVEIAGADRWAVTSGTLVYAPHGPFIIDSPAYMLASWTVATVQFSILGLWLASRFKPWLAAVLCAVIGGTNLPLYESLAFSAKWWEYRNVPMIFHAPYYVILGEVGIGLVFPVFAQNVFTRRPMWIPVLGLLLGLWMFVAGWLAFQVVG